MKIALATALCMLFLATCETRPKPTLDGNWQVQLR